MRFLLPLVAVLTLSIISTSCRDKIKDGYKAAYVINTGDITVDGCGYIFRLDNGNEEKPEYMPSAFTHDSLRILVKYHPSGKLDTCGFAQQPKVWNTVIIDEIERELK